MRLCAKFTLCAQRDWGPGDKDGNITEDTTVDKVTSETDSKIEPAGRIARLIKVLPGILMLLILAALAYYVTSVRFCSKILVKWFF